MQLEEQEMKQHISTRKKLSAVFLVSFLAGLAVMAMEGTFNRANAELSLTTAVCRSCHTGEWNFVRTLSRFDYTMAPAHHRIQRANNWNCTKCHIKDPVTGQLQIPTETDPNTGTLVLATDCTSCHGTTKHRDDHDFVGPPSTNCANCHAPNVVDEHVVNRGFDCAVCHSNPDFEIVIDSGRSGVFVSCYDCHETNDHHATTQAQSGQCTYCHADPRLEVDASAPTGQLACRQCHGSNQHNNGGPIQDFGACFACHQPTPYHPKPSQWPGWYQENDRAIGRGVFNLFKSEFKPRCAGNCENQYENRSSYGEHGQPARNMDRNWSTPTAKFEMVTFFDHFNTNQQWTVPKLTDGPVVTPPVVLPPPTDPPPTPTPNNDYVEIKKAEYDKDRRQVIVYAENKLGNLAQLSVNYNNVDYDMIWNSEYKRWQIKISVTSCTDNSIVVTSCEGGSDTETVKDCGYSSGDKDSYSSSSYGSWSYSR